MNVVCPHCGESNCAIQYSIDNLIYSSKLMLKDMVLMGPKHFKTYYMCLNCNNTFSIEGAKEEDV